MHRQLCGVSRGLAAELDCLGDQLEHLAAPLFEWLARAEPVLERYRNEIVDLPESLENAAWLEEWPEAGRVMGLALAVAARLERAAGSSGPETRDWDYVTHLLGEERAEALRAGGPSALSPATALTVEIVDQPVLAADPELGGWIQRLERRQETLALLFEAVANLLAPGEAVPIAVAQRHDRDSTNAA